MAINKVTLGGNTLIDLSGDTVSADKLAEGYTAHDKAGNPITGTMPASGISINGRTETRYANGNISAGDFVSSLPYSHSVDVEGEFNFGYPYLIAVKHYIDDVYIFCYGKIASLNSDNVDVYIQAVKMQGFVPRSKGASYYARYTKYNWSIHTSSAPYRKIYNSNDMQKDTIRILNGNLIVINIDGLLAVFTLNTETLSFSKLSSIEWFFSSYDGTKHTSLIRDNYYISCGDSKYDNKYLHRARIIKIKTDGLMEYGTIYTNGGYNANEECVVGQWLDYFSSDETGEIYFPSAFVQYKSSTNPLKVNLETLGIASIPEYSYVNSFLYNNLLYYQYPANTFKSYELNADGTLGTSTILTWESFKVPRNNYRAEKQGYGEYWIDWKPRYQASQTAYQKGMKTLICDNEGNTMTEYPNMCPAIIDTGTLFMIGNDEGDVLQNATKYKAFGTSKDISVRPYAGVIYGIAISNPVNNYVQVKIPQEA